MRSPAETVIFPVPLRPQLCTVPSSNERMYVCPMSVAIVCSIPPPVHQSGLRSRHNNPSDGATPICVMLYRPRLGLSHLKVFGIRLPSDRQGRFGCGGTRDGLDSIHGRRQASIGLRTIQLSGSARPAENGSPVVGQPRVESFGSGLPGRRVDQNGPPLYQAIQAWRHGSVETEPVSRSRERTRSTCSIAQGIF